jgi:8-oxo-dGTP pyrophosphatase MutT (NUDIX family)
MRKASTVILVREKNKRLEIYLLQRNIKSGFMGGLYVFPGGTVAPVDEGFDTWSPYVDLFPEQIESRLGGNGLSKEDALGFAVAAIRETLEEAGVVLATGQDKTENDLEELTSYRLQKNLPQSWFKKRILRENWQLSLSILGRWSHWITPKLMDKRFDTRFFIVSMPEDQTCTPDQWEASQGIWLDAQTALEKNLEATIPLSPPTIVTLTQLLQFKTVETLKQEIKTRTWNNPIVPCLVQSPDGPLILEPWDPLWGSADAIKTYGLAHKVLGPGSKFSRIWCDQGVWKPVGI